MAASYPSAVKSFSTKTDGPSSTISASHMNDVQDEIAAVENALINGVSHAVSLSSTLAVTGVATFTAASVFSSADTTVKAGASTETLKMAGVINVDSTQAGTGANTTDTTLFTYSLPADALNANGRTVRFTAWGTFGATANNKTVRLKWGGIAGDTIITITTAANAKGWVLQGLVVRTASNAQDLAGWAQTDFTVANTAGVTVATATQTDSGAVTLSVTSQNGTAAANDTVYEGSIIEFLN